MGPLAAKKLPALKTLADCIACGLCILPCPVWRQKRDMRFTWQGRAKAMQHGATANDIAESLLACAFCGSCDTLCPEGIDLKGKMAELRGTLADNPAREEIIRRMTEAAEKPIDDASRSERLFLAGEAFSKDEKRLSKILNLLDGSLAGDDGSDMALALEAGIEIPAARRERFLKPLRGAKEIILADGRLKQPLREWLPGTEVRGIGEVLSGMERVAAKLLPTDFYIIDSRAYNADYSRLVSHYDELRKKTTCTFNLDLNRIATPTTATSLHRQAGTDGIDLKEQLNWLLEGRSFERIVVENFEDGEALKKVTTVPVVHLADIV